MFVQHNIDEQTRHRNRIAKRRSSTSSRAYPLAPIMLTQAGDRQREQQTHNKSSISVVHPQARISSSKTFQNNLTAWSPTADEQSLSDNRDTSTGEGDGSSQAASLYERGLDSSGSTSDDPSLGPVLMGFQAANQPSCATPHAFSQSSLEYHSSSNTQDLAQSENVTSGSQDHFFAVSRML